MYRRVPILMRTAAALSVLLGVGVAAAQTPGTEVRHTVAVAGVPLDEALARIIDETELSLVYESRLVEGRTTFCRAERVTTEGLLACLLRGTGLDFVRLSSGTYVLIADPQTPPRYASLTGQVLDAETGLPLPDAGVLLADLGIGTATNRAGRFAFASLLPGPHRIVVTHVAYEAAVETVAVGPDERGRVSVALRPQVVLSTPVIVSGFEARAAAEGLGVSTRTPEDLASAGAPQDLVRSLSAVAGVHLGDALGDVHVQGGAANEQQVLLDGVPVFMPVPNGGFIGPFSPFAAGRVTVRKAGFGASDGSGLSGVIEVDHLLAPIEGPGLTARLDPLSLNARWTGHAGAPERVEARWMLAVRRPLWDTYQPARLETLFRAWATPDPFLYRALPPPTGTTLPNAPPGPPAPGTLEVLFSDLHAAGRVRFGGLRSLHVSFYDGAGTFGVERPEDGPVDEDLFEDAYRWRNRTAQLRYEWVQSHRLFLDAGVWRTRYRLAHPFGLSSPGAALARAEESNRLAETGLRLRGDWAASPRHTVAAAVEAVFTESAFALSLDPFGAAPVGPEALEPARWRVAGFLEDRFVVGPHASVTLGTRLTYLPLKEAVYAEPRLALHLDGETRGRGTWAARAAAGIYRQYLHAVDAATYNVASLLPRVRFWLPIDRLHRPPKAYHVALAAQYRPGPAWQFGVESYAKRQAHLLVLDYGARFAETPTGDVLREAEGYAVGAALTAAHRGRLHRLDAHYEIARTRRRTANRFGGAAVPAPWDAPHRLYLALDAGPVRHVTATVRWQGVFGRSWGLRQAYYDFLEPDPATRLLPPFDLADPGAHRLPAFSRWDVGLGYTRTVAGVGLQARTTLTNVFGRHNVTDWGLALDEATGTYVPRSRRAASFIPSFSVRGTI